MCNECVQIKADVRATCELCGSSDNTSIYPKSWNRHFHKCNACGHQWDHLSDSGDPPEIYFEDESYFYFSPFSHWLSLCSAKQRISILKRYLAHTAHVLEIGPGSGETLIAAEREGFDIEGVEDCSVFVSYLRSKAKATIYHGQLESSDFRGIQFDGIMSFHVLEHVRDTTGHLQRAFELMKPGGFLIIATPNLSSWDHRLLKRRWTGYSPGHLKLFGPKSIRLAMRQAGFTIVEIFTIESSFEMLWSIKSMIKLKKDLCKQAGSHIKRIPLHVGKIVLTSFEVVTIPLRVIQQKFDGGNELIVVAQKPK